MILNNYWAIITKAPACHPTSWGEISSTGLNLRGTSGQIYTIYYTGQNNTTNPWNYMANMFADVGDGTAEPASTDYCLQSSIKRFCEQYTETFNTVAENGKRITTVTITGVNSEGSWLRDLVIREVGIGGNLYVHTGMWGGPSPFLYVRELLPEPIVVPRNRGFSLTLEWVQE